MPNTTEPQTRRRGPFIHQALRGLTVWWAWSCPYCPEDGRRRPQMSRTAVEAEGAAHVEVCPCGPS